MRIAENYASKRPAAQIKYIAISITTIVKVYPGIVLLLDTAESNEWQFEAMNLCSYNFIVS